MEAPQIIAKKRRVFFYVDGFNLYHRRLQNNPRLKWLCLRTLAAKFLFPSDEVTKIKFFTAKVDPKPTSSLKQTRQLCYWKALKSTRVEVIEGLMEAKERECKVTYCDKKGATFQAMTEKMSDVNLALHVYRDFIQDPPDVICILSGDLDVIPALRMVRETKAKILLKIVLPNLDEKLMYSRHEILNGVAITSQLSEDHITRSRLPDKIEISPGVFCECPDSWK